MKIIIKNITYVGATLRGRPGKHRGLPLRLVLLMVVSLGLTACKINLDIFGKGTVQTASNTINCTSDGATQSGDCTQTYDVQDAQVSRAHGCA